MKIIKEYSNKKIYDYLSEKEKGKAIIVFNHGLGDTVIFLGIFELLQDMFPGWKLKIGFNDKREDFLILHKDSILVSDLAPKTQFKNYNYLFYINYHEPFIGDNVCKPILCNLTEIGIPSDSVWWKPYDMGLIRETIPNLVGFNFTGLTNKSFKIPSQDKINVILKELRENGYYLSDVKNLSLKDMIYVMKNCDQFIGVDSGPLYLAGSIIGYDNVIGIERYLDINKYLPLNIRKVTASFYRAHSIIEAVGEKKECCLIKNNIPCDSFSINKTPEKILITGGIGDFITLESFMSDEFKSNLKKIYYATRAEKEIRQLIQEYCIFPNLKQEVCVWNDFSEFPCFVKKEDIFDRDASIESKIKDVEDYSIFRIFKFIKYHLISYEKSSLLKHVVSNMHSFNSNKPYIVICPETGDNRIGDRCITKEEWIKIINYLRKNKLMGVIVSENKIEMEDWNIINLSGETSLMESIEIVKGAKGYIGIDSFLSVVASKKLKSDKMIIKSSNPHLYQHKNIYYAPHEEFSFIKREIDI